MGAMAFIPRSTDPIHKQLCEIVLSVKNRIVIEPETIFPASGLVFLPRLPGWGWGIALELELFLALILALIIQQRCSTLILIKCTF